MAAGRTPHAEIMRIFLRTSNTPDPRRYNGSSAPMEVAAILPGSNEEIRGGRDIVVHDSRRGLIRVSGTHPSYEPLAHPILNPTGVSGWHGNIDLGPQQGGVVHAPLCPQPDRGPMVACQATAFTATTDMTSRRHVEAKPGVARERRCHRGSFSPIASLIELDRGGTQSATQTSNSSACTTIGADCFSSMWSTALFTLKGPSFPINATTRANSVPLSILV